MRRRSRNSPGLNCSQAKTREEDEMKASLKKGPVGSSDEEADWGLLGVWRTKKVQAGKRKKEKKRKVQAVGTVMKTSCTEKDAREGDGKVDGKGNA